MPALLGLEACVNLLHLILTFPATEKPDNMDGGNWNTPRAEDLWTRDGSDGFRFETNTTSAWANELKFAAAESVRTSIIVLAGFNAVAAFVTAVGIFWKSWMTAKRSDPKWNPR